MNAVAITEFDQLIIESLELIRKNYIEYCKTDISINPHEYIIHFVANLFCTFSNECISTRDLKARIGAFNKANNMLFRTCEDFFMILQMQNTDDTSKN